MSGSNSLGRLPAGRIAPLEDMSSEKVAAMLSKQDETIAKLNAILAAIGAATDAASLYTQLAAVNTAPISEVILSL